MDAFDESGWWVGRGEVWSVADAWTLFAREDDSRMVEARWRRQGQRHFGLTVAVAPDKRYPSGSQPRIDRARVTIGADGMAQHRLLLQTLPAASAEGLREEAMAIADGGMDALIRHSPRIWQWRVEEGERGALQLAALLASSLLGPVWPPGGDGVFGVRGARRRLEASP